MMNIKVGLKKSKQNKTKEKHIVEKTVSNTCNHAVSHRHTLEHQVDEPHFSARLQVTDTLLEDCRKDAPDFSLTVRLTLVQQLHHADNALWFLDDEVHLQVKLATNKLQEKHKKDKLKMLKIEDELNKITFYVFMSSCKTYIAALEMYK